MLEIEAINSFYGDSHVLFDVSLHVEEHEVVAILGRNGAGKTTTLKTIAGVLSPRSGSIRLAGEPIHGLPSHLIARRGLQLVPDVSWLGAARTRPSSPRSGKRARQASLTGMLTRVP